MKTRQNHPSGDCFPKLYGDPERTKSGSEVSHENTKYPHGNINGRNEISAAFGLAAQLGVSMSACVLLGVLAGRSLDNFLGTSPALLVVCTLLGAAASFKVLYDLVIKKWM